MKPNDTEAARLSSPEDSNPTSLPRLYKLRTLAQRFDIPRTQLYDAVRMGDLKAHRIGRTLHVLEVDAVAWLQKQGIYNQQDAYPASTKAAGRG